MIVPSQQTYDDMYAPRMGAMSNGLDKFSQMMLGGAMRKPGQMPGQYQQGSTMATPQSSGDFWSALMQRGY